MKGYIDIVVTICHEKSLAPIQPCPRQGKSLWELVEDSTGPPLLFGVDREVPLPGLEAFYSISRFSGCSQRCTRTASNLGKLMQGLVSCGCLDHGHDMKLLSVKVSIQADQLASTALIPQVRHLVL